MKLIALRKVEIEIDGEKLAHYFADLRGDEWLEYQRVIGGIEGTERIDNLKRVLAIYDARCKKVEGYTQEDGADLMNLPDWRDFIPGDHKFAAWNELVSGANAKKNSPTNSQS